MQRGGSFFVLICLYCQTLEQTGSLSDSDSFLHGAVPSRRPTPNPSANLEANRQKEMLMVSAADIIHGSNPLVWRTAEIRQRSDQCASFEIGFVFRTMEEKYKKMLDMYNTSIQININSKERGQMGRMRYLQRIEQLHWEIYHLHNMMHEIERKYKMDSLINASGMWEGSQRWTRTVLKTYKTWTHSWGSRTTSWWRPLEYGWNTDYYFWK